MRPSSTAVDAVIAVVAAKQAGSITHRPLLDLGLDKHAIADRVKIGRLYRIHRGAVGRPATTPVRTGRRCLLASGLWSFLRLLGGRRVSDEGASLV